jgi:branched-chain amino acid transport system permease protein
MTAGPTAGELPAASETTSPDATGNRFEPTRLKRPLAAVITLAALAAVPHLVPGALSLIVVVGIFYIVLLGLGLLVGDAGQVSLGQTMFMAIGGYGAGFVTLRWHWPTTVALVAMAVVSAVVAALIGAAFLRLRGYYFALATLGLAVITESLASAMSGFTGGPSGMVGVPSLQLGGFTVFSDRANYYVLLVVGALGAWFIANLRRSQTGRVLAAISNDSSAAAMLGIRSARYKTATFVISAVFASVGGSLYAFYLRFISPEVIGVMVAFNVVIMVALGGARTLIGPLLGALLLQGLPLAGAKFALWQPFASGVVLILVMTYLPRGIWGGLRGIATRPFRRSAQEER